MTTTRTFLVILAAFGLTATTLVAVGQLFVAVAGA